VIAGPLALVVAAAFAEMGSKPSCQDMPHSGRDCVHTDVMRLLALRTAMMAMAVAQLATSEHRRNIRVAI
jgi:hypothetical protein